MQLNASPIKGIRAIRMFWISAIAVLVGLAFAAFGIYSLIADKDKTFEQTTATIQEIYAEDEYVLIDYQDKDGNDHTGVRLNSYEEKWSVGKEIKVYYNTEDFEDVRMSDSKVTLPIIFISLGSVVAVAGIAGLVYATKLVKRKTKPVGEIDQSTTLSDLPVNVVSGEKYFFHFCGKLNQSYTVDTPQGESVFKCNLLKFNPFGSNLYEFVDVKKGESKQIKIGKTLTTSSDEGMLSVVETLSSGFKIDGVNCWDYLANKGYEIKHMLEGKQIMRFDVVRGGATVATIVPADIKDPFNENNKNLLRLANGCYRLEITEANLADVVMCAFIVARVEVVE